MRPKRLFLFAAYDAGGTVGPALCFHIKALSAAGDVVAVMDNDSTDGETGKLRPYVRHIEARRHNEYDFGSYKRAWQWSREHLELEEYDYCYLVNDSVYGPMQEIGPMLEAMESLGARAFGPVVNPHRREPHIQSWFVGMGKEVFLSGWFDSFMSGITRQEDMGMIYRLYEIGLTELFASHGIEYDSLFRFRGKAIYNSVKDIFLQGLPFIKKSSFTRHNGSLGAEVKYILDYCAESGSAYMREAAGAVAEDSRRVYGEAYMERFLCPSRAEMLRRHLIYLFRKTFKQNHHG